VKVGGRLLVVFALVVVLTLHVAYLLPLSPRHGFFDLTIYRGAARWWLDHRSLYSFIREGTSKGFTYPPFAVLVLLPMALVSKLTAIVVTTAASASLVLAITWWLVVPVADRHGWSRWFAVAVAVPLMFAMEPIHETLGWGQINIFLAALVLADVHALRRGRPWAGVGIGLATAIKLTPGLFVVYLALSGRFRAAATAAATFAAATLLAFALDAPSSVRFWTDALFQTGRVGRVDRAANQSLLGALARVTDADPARADTRVWLLLCAVLLALGLARAVDAARRGDELTGVTLTGLLTCLISPISWTHHLFWVIPAALVLADVAWGTPLHGGAPGWLRTRPAAVRLGTGLAAAGVVTAFLISLVWFFDVPEPGAHHNGGVLGMLGENAYVLIMIALLVLLPVRDVVPAEPSAARSSAPARPAGSSPR
jgi:alpha-1,2-mannosyltransferase